MTARVRRAMEAFIYHAADASGIVTLARLVEIGRANTRRMTEDELKQVAAEVRADLCTGEGKIKPRPITPAVGAVMNSVGSDFQIHPWSNPDLNR